MIEEQNQYKQIPDIINQQIPEMNPIQPLNVQQPLPMPIPSPQIVPQPVVNPLTSNPGIAPLPPTGLPEGWTMDQWEHYGWKYMESFKK